MKIRFFNIYYLFFSIALSAAVYPSIMGIYPGNIINIGIATLVLDELILLSSLILMILHVFKTQRISYKISGHGGILLFILSWIMVVFIFSFLRADNSIAIISRDRWIFLNALVLLMPFVYQPTSDDLTLMFHRFFIWLLILATIKLGCYFLVGPSWFVSQIGPSFIFMLSLSLVVYLWSSTNISSKFIASGVVLFLSLLSQQMSAILLTLLCVVAPIYFSYFKTFFLPSLFMLGLGLLVMISLITVDLSSIAASYNLNPLNFTVIDKLLVYWEMWSAPFNNVSLFDFIFGRGAGYSFNMVGYNEILNEYIYASHSLAHNFIITILMKFGLVGFILFSVIIFAIFQPLSQKFNFDTSVLLKLVLLLILFNFLSTPGIWKIRKGIFLWFVVGLCYFYRRYRVTENV